MYSAYNENLEKRGSHIRSGRQRTRERQSGAPPLISTEKRPNLVIVEETGSEVDPP